MLFWKKVKDFRLFFQQVIETAHFAYFTIVFAYVFDEQGKSLGISSFAIPENAQGLRQGSEALTMGMRGMIQNKIDLNQVPVNSSQILGEIGAGFDVAQDAMQLGRLGISVICIGGMKRSKYDRSV